MSPSCAYAVQRYSPSSLVFARQFDYERRFTEYECGDQPKLRESLAMSTSSTSRSSLSLWLAPFLLVAAVIAAYAGELVTANNKERFFTPEGLPPFPPELLREIMWNNIFNHSICYGSLGAFVCGLVAMVASGLAGPARAFVGFVVGSIMGLILGAATGSLGYFLTKYLQPRDIESIFMAMIIFAPVWLALAITSSVTTVLAIGRAHLIGKAIVNSLAMAGFATILFPFFVTFVFPSDWPGRIIPEHSRSRLSCYIIGSLCIAVSVWLTVRPDPKRD